MSDIGGPMFSLFFFAVVLFYPGIALVLSGLRMAVARGPSRVLAGIAALASIPPLAGILFQLPLGDAYFDALLRLAGRFGAIAVLAPILVPLALSGVVRGHRWVALDGVHVVALAGIVLLWVMGL